MTDWEQQARRDREQTAEAIRTHPRNLVPMIHESEINWFFGPPRPAPKLIGRGTGTVVLKLEAADGRTISD